MKAKDQDIASILFAGDFAPINYGEYVNFKIDPEIKKLIDGTDGFYVNLEAPITSRNKRRIKAGPGLKLNDSSIKIIKKCNISGVSLANNHVFDYGIEGIHETIDILDKNAIKSWGVGPNKAKSSEPFIIKKNNLRLAIVSYAEHEFNWISNNDWCTALLDPAANVIQIQKLADAYDFVIIFSHTGPENCHYPSPRQVTLFRHFIDSGASAVINSHSHTIMGMEIYKGKPIYYGLGNFFFPLARHKESWYSGLIVNLSFEKHGGIVSSQSIPIHFDNQGIFLNRDVDTFHKTFTEFSEIFKDENLLKMKWDEFGELENTKLRKEYLKAFAAIGIGKVLKILAKRRGNYYQQKGWAILRNFHTCENHVDNISNILNNKLHQ